MGRHGVLRRSPRALHRALLDLRNRRDPRRGLGSGNVVLRLGGPPDPLDRGSIVRALAALQGIDRPPPAGRVAASSFRIGKPSRPVRRGQGSRRNTGGHGPAASLAVPRPTDSDHDRDLRALRHDLRGPRCLRHSPGASRARALRSGIRRHLDPQPAHLPGLDCQLLAADGSYLRGQRGPRRVRLRDHGRGPLAHGIGAQGLEGARMGDGGGPLLGHALARAPAPESHLPLLSLWSARRGGLVPGLGHGNRRGRRVGLVPLAPGDITPREGRDEARRAAAAKPGARLGLAGPGRGSGVARSPR